MSRKLKADLEKENELLYAKLAKLEDAINALSNPTSSVSTEMIPMTKIIKVVSLYDGILNLRTAYGQAATIFKFNFFGDEQPIFYSDLVKCISMQQRFFKDGFVMILDEEVVKAHYLVEHYKDLLNKDQINSFLNFNEFEINSIYPKLTTQQKITVLQNIANKINANTADRNKVDIVSNISKVDLNELANKLK